MSKRAEKTSIAAATRIYNDVLNNEDDRQALRCADLVAKFPVTPATTVLALRRFSIGIFWMLEQVELLEQHLQTHTSLEPHQRLLAIRLTGRNSRDMFTDPIVKQWNLDYLSGLYGAGNITVAQAAELLAEDRPVAVPLNEFDWILAKWLKELVSVKEGQALLRQSVAELKAELQERLQEIEKREAVDRELALEQAKLTVDAECMKYLRYIRESDRGNQAAMRQFHQLQMVRLKYGDQLASAAEDEDSAPAEAASAPQPGPSTAEESPSHQELVIGYRNEAGAAQADGGPAGSSEPRTFSTVDFAIGRSPGTPETKADGATEPHGPRRDGSEVLRE
jgi:hypothetical protein